jgi:cell division protein FtsZ
MRFAEAGIAELLKVVDTLLIIPNQNLFRVANEKTTFADAFALADQVLYSGVACISDLIVKEGLINLDFADVLSVMREKGKAMMGRGEASGEKRVLAAAVAAISNPLIENPSIKRASGLIISITGGKDLTLFEVDEAATRIREEADQDANIIVGASFDENLEGIVRVSVVATGIDNLDPARQAQPAQSSLTELAGRLRNDSRRIADRIERGAPLPQSDSPPLRPSARQPRRATGISAPCGSAGPQSVRPAQFDRGKRSRCPGLPAPQGQLSRRKNQSNPFPSAGSRPLRRDVKKSTVKAACGRNSFARGSRLFRIFGKYSTGNK